MTRPLLLGLVAGLSCLGLLPLHGAEMSTPVDPEAIQRKAEEVEKLQRELERAREELRLLREAAGQASPATPAPSPAELPTTTPPTTDPVGEDEVVNAADLVRHFRSDPEKAAARYGGRTFPVDGLVLSFDLPLLTRSYSVTLDSPEKFLPVTCRFNYVNKYRSVVTRDNGRTLVGRIDERSTRVLFRQGETVRIRGRCQGLEDGQIVMQGCVRVR